MHSQSHASALTAGTRALPRRTRWGFAAILDWVLEADRRHREEVAVANMTEQQLNDIGLTRDQLAESIALSRTIY